MSLKRQAANVLVEDGPSTKRGKASSVVPFPQEIGWHIHDSSFPIMGKIAQGVVRCYGDANREDATDEKRDLWKKLCGGHCKFRVAFKKVVLDDKKFPPVARGYQSLSIEQRKAAVQKFLTGSKLSVAEHAGIDDEDIPLSVLRCSVTEVVGTNTTDPTVHILAALNKKGNVRFFRDESDALRSSVKFHTTSVCFEMIQFYSMFDKGSAIETKKYIKNCLIEKFVGSCGKSRLD